MSEEKINKELFDLYRYDILKEIKVSEVRLIRDWSKHIGQLPGIQNALRWEERIDDKQWDLKKELYQSVISDLLQYAVENPLRPVSALYMMVNPVLARKLMARIMMDNPTAKELDPYKQLLQTLRGIIKDITTVAGFSEEITKSLSIQEHIITERISHQNEVIFRLAIDYTLQDLIKLKMMNDTLKEKFYGLFEENLEKAAKEKFDVETTATPEPV